jgi:DNA-binding response OmpR family regulator
MKVLSIQLGSSFAEISREMSKDWDDFVENAHTLKEASEKAHLYDYDCILLYCDLSQETPEKLLLGINSKQTQSGLIVLSRNHTVSHTVKILHAGADDCLTIPCHPDEVHARMLAIVRRRKLDVRNKLHFANLVIELVSRDVFVWDERIALTRKEYDLLLYLVMNKYKTVSQLMLTEYLWGESSESVDSGNLLVTHLKNLRKKLKHAKAELEIKNQYGLGYQIVEI